MKLTDGQCNGGIGDLDAEECAPAARSRSKNTAEMFWLPAFPSLWTGDVGGSRRYCSVALHRTTSSLVQLSRASESARHWQQIRQVAECCCAGPLAVKQLADA
jgi:hypothetical protein